MRLTDEQRLKVEYNKGFYDGVRGVVEAFDYDVSSIAERFPTAKELTDFINKWLALKDKYLKGE